jgi:hypothetical protein
MSPPAAELMRESEHSKSARLVATVEVADSIMVTGVRRRGSLLNHTVKKTRGTILRGCKQRLLREAYPQRMPS